MIALLFALQQPTTDTTAAGRPCEVALDSVGHTGRQVEVGPGQVNYFAGGGVLGHCKGSGTTLSADSVAWYSGTKRFDMIGHVHIVDTTLTLDANLAYYYIREERLEAHNNVVAKNRANGSVLRGPNLNYLRAARGVRDTMEMFANTRPTITYRASTDSGEPYVIVGDRVHFKGSDRMWAGGKVTVDRSDLAARADSMAMNQSTGDGVLLGGTPLPHVEGKGDQHYSLDGTRINLQQDAKELKLVKALGKGSARGSDWTLTADTIELHLADRKLQQAFAWGDSSRPHAVSPLHTITSDSLALDVPDEVLTEARAYRRAFSLAKHDSTTALKDADWIAGDTLTAHWTPGRDSTGKQKSQLDHLIARGSARAFTHQFDDKDKTAPPSLNYSRGRVITITMASDRMDRVTVAGQADGIQLDPRKAPVDTTKKKATKP